MNKFNKGKLIGVVAASLSAVSLMGVGFASWIITGTSDNIDAGNIEVTVVDIQDKRVVFEGTPSISEGKLAFDADGTKTSGGLIAADDKTNKEDMKFTISYVVKAYTAAASGWKVTAKLMDNTSGALNAAVSNKYIKYPTTSKALTLSESVILDNGDTSTTGLTITKDTTNSEFTKYTVLQEFTFTWGEAFNNVNPVEVKKNDSIYTGKEGVANGKEGATTDLLVTNLRGLNNLNFSGLKLQLSTALKTSE